MTAYDRINLPDAFWFQEGPGLRKWQFTTSGIKVLNVGNIMPDGSIDLSRTDRHVSVEEFEQRYIHFGVDAGDLVMASSGISFDDDGFLRTKIAFVEEDHLPLCMNTSTIRFKAIDGVSCLEYLRHWLQSVEFRRQVSRLVTGTAQLNFGPGHLKQMTIGLPPLEEQWRIAGILDAADALRRRRREALALLDTLPGAIFAEMFGDVQETYTLKEAGTDFRYGTSSKSQDHGLPVLRIPNVVGGDVDLSEIKTVPLSAKEEARFALKDGDILLVRTNGNQAYVGRSAVFNREKVAAHEMADRTWSFASYLIRARLKEKELLPDFIQGFLSSAEGRKQLLASSKTSAGQFNINTEALGAIRVPKVAVPAQTVFVDRVAGIKNHRKQVMGHLSELETLFASLQSRAFAGEL